MCQVEKSVCCDNPGRAAQHSLSVLEEVSGFQASIATLLNCCHSGGQTPPNVVQQQQQDTFQLDTPEYV